MKMYVKRWQAQLTQHTKVPLYPSMGAHNIGQSILYQLSAGSRDVATLSAAILHCLVVRLKATLSQTLKPSSTIYTTAQLLTGRSPISRQDNQSSIS